MIQSSIVAALVLLWTLIDDLYTIVTACENMQGQSSAVSASKVKAADPRKDIDYLKSTEFTSLIQEEDDLDTLETSGIPPNTTRDTCWEEVVVDELYAKTDEEKIEVQEASIY